MQIAIIYNIQTVRIHRVTYTLKQRNWPLQCQTAQPSWASVAHCFVRGGWRACTTPAETDLAKSGHKGSVEQPQSPVLHLNTGLEADGWVERSGWNRAALWVNWQGSCRENGISMQHQHLGIALLWNFTYCTAVTVLTIHYPSGPDDTWGWAPWGWSGPERRCSSPGRRREVYSDTV